MAIKKCCILTLSLITAGVGRPATTTPAGQTTINAFAIAAAVAGVSTGIAKFVAHRRYESGQLLPQNALFRLFNKHGLSTVAVLAGAAGVSALAAYGTPTEQQSVLALGAAVGLPYIIYRNSVSLDREALMQTAHYYYSQQMYRESLNAYLRAADAGAHEAYERIAHQYYYGEGIEQNYEKALDWYRKAARGGYATAQYYLAMMIQEGKGAAQNTKKAAKWLSRAAAQGYRQAQNKLQEFATAARKALNK